MRRTLAFKLHGINRVADPGLEVVSTINRRFSNVQTEGFKAVLIDVIIGMWRIPHAHGFCLAQVIIDLLLQAGINGPAEFKPLLLSELQRF